MRLLAALIYIAIGMVLYKKLVTTLGLSGDYVFWVGGGLFFLLMYTSETIFNEHFLCWIQRKNYRECVEGYIEKGKAKVEHFAINSALSFEDHGTGCLVYLLEVDNRKILCLYGQDYYDYEPNHDPEEDPVYHSERSFPTTEFSLVRKTKNGEVLDVWPGSTVIEPITLDAPDLEKLETLGFQLDDGEIVEGCSLETVFKSLS